jgi:hypothetical protein
VVYRAGRRIGLVENVESLQWLVEWQDEGEFKLTCPCTAQAMALFQQWDVLYNPDTPNVAAILTSLTRTMDEDGVRRLVARGQMSVHRWRDRVARSTDTVTDAAVGLLALAADNLRGLPVTVPTAAEFPAPCSETLAWCECLAAFRQLAQAGGFGFCHRFDPATAAETLTLLPGTDRRQGSAYHGFFGTQMDNLSGVKVTLDGSNYRNVATIGGEQNQEYTVRLFAETGDTAAQGAARRELWVDGSAVHHRYTDGSGNVQVRGEEEYLALLRQRGAQALLQHLNDAGVQATARGSGLVYGTGYALGDLIPVRVPELGLSASARVKGVQFSYDAKGRTVRPLFGFEA